MDLSFRPSQRVFDECPWSLHHRHHDTGLYRGFRWLVGRQHIHARTVSQIDAIQPIRQIVPTPFAPSPDKSGEFNESSQQWLEGRVAPVHFFPFTYPRPSLRENPCCTTPH